MGEPNRAQGYGMDTVETLKQQVELLQRELVAQRQGATNFGFVQVSKKHIDDLNALARQSPAAHATLWALCKAMDKQNAVMVSQDSLAKLTGYSKATLKRAVALLRDQMWVQVLKVGTSNVYRVNSAVFWQARANGRWASFSAEVLVNFDEQDEATKKAPSPKLRHIPMVQAGEDVLIPDASKPLPPPDQPMMDFHSSELVTPKKSN